MPLPTPAGQPPNRLALSLLCASLAAASLTACAQSPQPGAATDPVGATTADADATAPAAPGAEPTPEPGTADARARDAIKAIAPQLRVDRIGAAPVAGFRQVIVGGQVVYVSDDGRYLLQGTLLDVAARKDLNEVAMAAMRRDLVATVPASDRIVFAPESPVHTVAVFTDVDCGYCRKMHGEMDQYHARGIAIEYLAFPRMGPGSENFEEMAAVWCAKDPREALTRAKAGGEVRGADCTNPVAMQYAMGQRVGLTGTPMIVAADGSQLGGYVPAARLREMLDERAGTGPAPAAPADMPAADPAAGGSR